MFRDEFKQATEKLTIETEISSEREQEILAELNEAETKLEKIKKDLRDNNIKIKNIIPTNFGVELILFNKDDAISASKIIKTNKVKNNSVFVAI